MQKAFKFTDEKLKVSLNKMGINDSLIEVALPKFNKSDTLMILKTGERIQQPDMTNLYKIKVPESKKRQDIIDELKKMPEVLYAEPNGKIIHHAIPSDTRFGDQWGLRNTIRLGADIHAEAAWDIYTGNANNIIAIVDGGTQTTHVDLNDKISGGDTGFGWGGHGIHVSGIAAAESNNAQGISGVDWQARIHPQRIDNVTDDAATYQAIIDAVNFSSNVHVLNNSWGLTDEDGNSGRYSTTVRQAFAYAYKANRTSVVSMGNHQLTQPGVVGYPAGFGNVIAVGATNNADVIANFSAQGNHIDVCAPGVDILSTINGGYGFMSGTSMAAPHVSGIASLLKGFNPNLANDDIENIIRLSADDVNGNGFDPQYGFGRVNAERALNLLRAPNTLSQWSGTSGTTVSSSGTFNMVFMGAPGLASSAYIVKRHEVRKTINYPSQFLHIEGVWGRGVFTNGWNQANPNFGEGFCEVVPGTQTNTSVTLRTYVYQIWSISGSYLGYYPKSPSNVTFAYTVLGVQAPTLSGPTSVCTDGATFTVNGLPTGATISWTYSSNLQAYYGGSNFIALRAIGSGSGWVQARINSVYGQYTIPLKSVSVGIKASFTGSTSVLVGKTGTWTGSASCGTAPYNYDWFLRKDGTGMGAVLVATGNPLTLKSVTAGKSYLSTEKVSDPIINQPITQTIFYLYARAFDANGNVNITPEKQIVAYGNVDLVPAYMPYMQKSASLAENQELNQLDTYLEIFPNPVSDNITINIVSSDEEKSENKVLITIFDSYMSKSKVFNTNSKENVLNVSDLRKGIYIIQVQYGEKQWIEKILVE